MHLCVLHKNKQYIEDCAAVLNEEWSRSQTARIYSLEKSSDRYPINLVLLDDKDVPIGHSRLAKVVGKDKACFVESVVIKKALRGKGLGKLLMQETEKFAKNAGFETVYLTTHDKQDFYKHVGYDFCQPIISCGIQPTSLPQGFLDKLAGTSLKDADKTERQQKEISKKIPKEESSTPSNACATPPPLSTLPNAPAAPPPPPPLLNAPATLPPPPPPPNAPTAPPPLKGNKSDKNLHPEISKFDPREISWMKKEL